MRSRNGQAVIKLRRVVTATALAFGVALTALTATPAQDQAFAASECSTNWGSLTKIGTDRGAGSINNIRSGRHQCYDRLVVDLQDADGPTGYRALYQDPILELGRGWEVPVRGGAQIAVTIEAKDHDGFYNPTYKPVNKVEAVDVNGYETFRQVYFTGGFEGQTLVAIGVRARLPMRVFTLTGPGDTARLVIDVAHHW